MTEYEDPVRVVEQEVEVPYRYSTGYDYMRFFDELANNERIMGRKCKDGETVLVPPRPFTGVTYDETREWVEVGPEATVLGFGIVHNEVPGQPSEPPFIYIEIQFHGADTKVPHIAGGADIEALRETVTVGAEVVPTFKPVEERTGSWDDIEYFKPTALD